MTSSFKGRSSVQAAAGWQFRPGLSWPYGSGWGISTGLELAARGPWSLKPFEDAGLGDRKPQCLNLASRLWFVEWSLEGQATVCVCVCVCVCVRAWVGCPEMSPRSWKDRGPGAS